MKLSFKDVRINELQNYIGKKVYIIHPGISKSPYWGTIDSESPHLLSEIIKGFYISKLGTEIITGNNRYDSFNINDYNIYFDEETAKQDLNKLI